MMWVHRSRIGLAALLVLAAGAAAAAPEPGKNRPPESRVGPYRVVVEKVTEQQYAQALFLAQNDAKAPARSGRRSAHISLRLVAETPEASLAVEQFAVHAATVSTPEGEMEVPHYGGPLEDSDDAVLRAYLYAGNVGMETTELRSIEGEITAFERARIVAADLTPGPAPVTHVVDGLTLTMVQCVARGSTATLRLKVRAPADAQVVPAGTDGTYGIQLFGAAEARAEPGASLSGSTLSTMPDGEMQFELSYRGLKGAPSRVHVELLMRQGARKTYPFRIEHVPLPKRLAGGER